MKRLIGIAVAFAIVATGAFAQVRVSGQISAGATLLAGDNGDDSDVTASGAQQWVSGQRGTSARLQLDAGNDTIGARVRLFTNGIENPAFAFVWWRPLDILRLQFGRNPDGDWGGAQITGWGFTGDPKNIGVAMNRGRDPLLLGDYFTAHGVGFYDGVNFQSVQATLFPIDGLALNIAIPFPDIWQANNDNATPNPNNQPGMLASEAWRRLHVHLRYAIGDIGTVRLTYVGGSNDDDASTDNFGRGVNAGTLARPRHNPGDNAWGNPQSIWASFFSNSLVDGLDVDFGLGFYIPEDDIQAPMEIGLGARYTMGDFNIRFRSGFRFIGSYKEGDDTLNTPVLMGFAILPNYNFGSFRVFLNTGMDIELQQEGDEDAFVAWFVNPYIQVPVSGFNFFAGFKLFNGRTAAGGGTTTDKSGMLVNWKVPIGVIYNF